MISQAYKCPDRSKIILEEWQVPYVGLMRALSNGNFGGKPIKMFIIWTNNYRNEKREYVRCSHVLWNNFKP